MKQVKVKDNLIATVGFNESIGKDNKGKWEENSYCGKGMAEERDCWISVNIMK